MFRECIFYHIICSLKVRPNTFQLCLILRSGWHLDSSNWRYSKHLATFRQWYNGGSEHGKMQTCNNFGWFNVEKQCTCSNPTRQKSRQIHLLPTNPMPGWNAVYAPNFPLMRVAWSFYTVKRTHTPCQNLAWKSHSYSPDLSADLNRHALCYKLRK